MPYKKAKDRKREKIKYPRNMKQEIKSDLQASSKIVYRLTMPVDRSFGSNRRSRLPTNFVRLEQVCYY